MDGSEADETGGTGLQMDRRELLKVGAAGLGLAALGSLYAGAAVNEPGNR